MIINTQKPICFLDFDGVMNSVSWFMMPEYKELRANNPYPHISHFDDIDPRAVEYLNEIADWNFVVSSTWRKFYSLEQINELFALKGFRGKFIDKTPILEFKGALRGNEIYLWLTENIKDSSDFSGYVIYDDDGDMLYWQKDNFIHVDGYFGIGPNHIYRAKRFVDKMPPFELTSKSVLLK